METISKYLPFKKFHIVKLDSLFPDAIKKAAKHARTDREDISHTTILNAVVSSLGFKGGFASYQSHFESELVPFMKENGLIKHADLFHRRKKGYLNSVPQVSPQALSERLFFSGRGIPNKVFTGYDFNFLPLDDGNDFMNLNHFMPIHAKYGAGWGDSIEDIIHWKKIVGEKGQLEIACQNGKKYRLIELVAGGFVKWCFLTGNLIGDSFFQPMKRPAEVQLYGDLSASEINRYRLMFSFFRELIEEGDEGWVDIIPFNPNLIFLKGRDGDFDFVFKNQRDKRFKHEAFGGSMRISDVPSFIEDYHFDRWQYFEHCGWREYEKHEAEEFFYASGGTPNEYPGTSVVYKNYYRDKGLYSPRYSVKCNKLLDRFSRVSCKGELLAVSNVVTISEFSVFAKENPDYLAERKGDSLKPVNDEQDKELPVSLTWFDAVRYIKWYQDVTGVAVRLLTLNEYKAIREVNTLHGRDASKYDKRRDIIFYNEQNEPYQGHPPYMGREEFDDLVFRFSPKFKESEFGNDLKFYSSNFFAEWLVEKTCIRSGNLKGFYNDDLVVRSPPPCDSTGKYKSLKIGFRLCYELHS